MNSNQGRRAPRLAAVASWLFALVFCFLSSGCSCSSVSSPLPPPHPTPSHLTLRAQPTLTRPTQGFSLSKSYPFPPAVRGRVSGWQGQGGQRTVTYRDIWTIPPNSNWQDGETLLLIHSIFVHLFISFSFIYPKSIFEDA